MATTQTPLQARLESVRERIVTACERAGRAPESVTLVAVSKTFPATVVREAAAAGQRHFGENYVQESVEKIALLRDLCGEPDNAAATPRQGTSAASPPQVPAPVPLIWHFIGPVQSNKTRLIAQHFQWVHTIEREKIARRLAAQRDAHLPPLQVCIEVNVSSEESKSGVTPQELPALSEVIAQLPQLRLRGLMAIPEPTRDESLARRRFAGLRELLEAENRRGHKMDTLSMGMTADMEAAIAEGATMVRIGTAIFGERK